MKPHPNELYSYRVQWSEEDSEFAGLCTEFPSLSWLAESPEKAFRGIRKVVDDVVEDMKQNKEPIPEPMSMKKFSGKFMVRVLPEVHRMLAITAADEGVSLNRYINAKLSYTDPVLYTTCEVAETAPSEYLSGLSARHPRSNIKLRDVARQH
jgi:predicted HicB family RNase H-like nuclease